MKKTTQHKHEEEMLEQMIKFSGKKMLEEQGDLLDEEDGELELPQELQDSILKMIEDKRAEEQKQTKQLARRTLRRKVGRKLAASIVLVATIGLVGGSVIMSVDAWRIPILNLIFKSGNEGTELQFNDMNDGKVIKVASDLYYPSYIPEGFTSKNESKGEIKNSIVYMNQNEDVIVFSVNQSEETIWTLYTDEEKKTVYVNGYEGYIVQYEAGISVIWGNEDLMFTVYGDISESEAIKIAESVE